MYCQNCGEKLEEDMQFCPECGAPNIDEDDQTMGLTQQFETLEKGTNTNNKKPKHSKLWIPIAILCICCAAGGIFWAKIHWFTKTEDSQSSEAHLYETKDYNDSKTSDNDIAILTPKDQGSNLPELTGTPGPLDEITGDNGLIPESDGTDGSNGSTGAGSSVGEGDVSSAENGGSSDEADLETQIQEIRDIYYTIQNNLDSFEVQDGGGSTTRYIDENGYIRKISAQKGSYSGVECSQIYAAEFYYQIIDGKYLIRFVFIFGNGEEHRIYLDKSGTCIRYINEYGTIYNNSEAQAQLEARADIDQLSSMGLMEIHWAVGDRNGADSL